MRVHYFQHVPFEGLGSIEPWLRERGATVSATRFYAQDGIPPLADIDMLIVMGGPMSVHDEAQFAWLRAEKAYIAAAMKAGYPVLGICLGAQLIAEVAGGRVTTNSSREIGWFPVVGLTTPEAGVFCLPPHQTVFHWHGEAFSLPQGAVRLARSEACDNQAFQLGQAVIGLQFHLEMTPLALSGMIQACGEEIVPGPFVHNADRMTSDYSAHGAESQALMAQVLAYLWSCPGRSNALR